MVPSKRRLKLLRFLCRVTPQGWRNQLFRLQGAQIAPDAFLLVHDLGSDPFLVRIDSHSAVAGGVQFITHDGATWVFRADHPEVTRFGAIWVRENCMIGNSAIILPNTIIGPNSVVGAGAVVTKNVPPGVVVAGSPAKVICTVDEYAQRCVAESPDIPRGKDRLERIARWAWDKLEKASEPDNG